MSMENDIKTISKTLKSIEQLLTASATPEQLAIMNKINGDRLRFQDTQASLIGGPVCTRL